MDLITLGDLSRATMAFSLGGALLSVFYIIYYGVESALIVATYIMVCLAMLLLVVYLVSSGFGLNSTFIKTLPHLTFLLACSGAVFSFIYLIRL